MEDEEVQALDSTDVEQPMNTDEEFDLDVFEEPTVEPVEKKKYMVKVDKEELEVDEDELVNGYQRQADYTRSKQSLAEERKLLAQEREKHQAEVFKVQEANEAIETLTYYKKLAESKLASYSEVDWAKENATNPLAANQKWLEYQMLKENAGKIDQEISKEKQLLIDIRNKEYEISISKLTSDVSKEVPAWDSIKGEVAQMLMGDIGFTEEELKHVSTVREIKLFELALLGSKYKKAVEAKKAKLKQADTTVQVGTASKSKSSASSSSAEQEWKNALKSVRN